MSDMLQKIRAELRENSDARIRESSKRYFKEDIKVYGIKTAAVTQISKKHFAEIKGLGKSEIFSLCEELLRSGYMEESFIACNWSYALRSGFEEKDFATFERWVREYVSNWATCDTLCNHTVGAFIEKFPPYSQSLKKWAKSSNRWMKRASAVSLIVPAKKGQFLKDALEIADILLEDEDDLVQKGYGWLLKEESKTRQAEVFKYVMKNKHRMPRTALRYAIEKMPASLKSKAMER